MSVQPDSRRGVVLWLMVVSVTIVAMIMVGGATRLTDSGLSMVEWEPIMGVIPPLSAAEWEETFEAYKQYPEYQKVNRHMDVEEFKSIFYWEYFHRLLGRLIGMLFLLPFLYYWARGAFSAGLRNKLLIAFLIGGLQGLMGWYMVMSGLVDMPRVSHYRLAAHLGIALLLLAYLFWIILDLVTREGETVRGDADLGALRGLALAVMALLCLQIAYGAFTAGLRAGFGYNTFPLMHDQWIADAVGAMQPFWLNLVESNATVQFIHRTLGIALVLLVLLFWWQAMRAPLNALQRRGAHLLLATTAVQFLLGVVTLVWVVPLVPAVIHQGVASLLLLNATLMIYVLLPGRARGAVAGD